MRRRWHAPAGAALLVAAAAGAAQGVTAPGRAPVCTVAQLRPAVLAAAPPPLILPLPLPLLPAQPVPCPTTPGLHFDRYIQSQFNWGAPLGPLPTVMASQWLSDHNGYGSGRNDFADHYRVEFEQEATSKALRHFVFPTIFHQDELYQPLEAGGAAARIAHAARHLLLTDSDDHTRQVFNAEALPAAFAAAAIGSRFEPGSQRSWRSTRANFGWNVEARLASDLISEFSPGFRRLLP